MYSKIMSLRPLKRKSDKLMTWYKWQVGRDTNYRCLIEFYQTYVRTLATNLMKRKYFIYRHITEKKKHLNFPETFAASNQQWQHQTKGEFPEGRVLELFFDRLCGPRSETLTQF